MMRQGPTVPVLLSTDLGEMKIPEPMMVPTMIQMPLIRPTWDVQEGRRVNAATPEVAGTRGNPLHPLMTRSAERQVHPGMSTCAITVLTAGQLLGLYLY